MVKRLILRSLIMGTLATGVGLAFTRRPTPGPVYPFCGAWQDAQGEVILRRDRTAAWRFGNKWTEGHWELNHQAYHARLNWRPLLVFPQGPQLFSGWEVSKDGRTLTLCGRTLRRL
jgi:hypothetical protein